MFRKRTDGTPRWASAATEQHGEQRIEALREDARYRRERLALYRARLYGGRPLDASKLRELERSSDGAAARLRQAERQAPATRSSD